VSYVDSSGQASFDAGGIATVRFGPVPPGGRWRITNLSVSTTSALRTTARVYKNAVSPAQQRDVSVSGGNSDSSDTVHELLAGETLIVQWTGGTPGATATATIGGA
jgi:hypothetical protein